MGDKGHEWAMPMNDAGMSNDETAGHPIKIITLPRESRYRIREPKNLYPTMRRDIQLLQKNGSYQGLATLIVCFIDTLAAGTGEANRSKFADFIMENFPCLCADLNQICSVKKTGAETFYDAFRNGFAHLGAPKDRFAIADNAELDGAWAGIVKIEGDGQFIAININRLAAEFVDVLDRLIRNLA
jgi:hypothetical protein